MHAAHAKPRAPWEQHPHHERVAGPTRNRHAPGAAPRPASGSPLEDQTRNPGHALGATLGTCPRSDTRDTPWERHSGNALGATRSRSDILSERRATRVARALVAAHAIRTCTSDTPYERHMPLWRHTPYERHTRATHPARGTRPTRGTRPGGGTHPTT